MKVICAPDSFKESLSAVQAANAMAAGVERASPGAMIDRCPVGDGGEGTLESLLDSVNGQRIAAVASNVFGREIETDVGSFAGGQVAFVESAAAIGLTTIPVGERDVMHSSSFGVGQLILSALDSAPQKVIVGVGGSATNDGGCGMAQALGVRFFDGAGDLIEQPISAAMLPDIRRIDATHRTSRLDDIEIVVACDVENPLTGSQGAAQIYAAQKGASDTQVVLLDDSLGHIAELIRHDLAIDIETTTGAGAAGGLGGGLVAFTGAKIVSGIDTVLEAVRFSDRVQDADLCLTGEGCLDTQSLAGKACIGVAKIASAHNVTTVALVGCVGPGAQQTLQAGISEYVAIGEGLSTEQSIRQAATLLTNAAVSITRKYC